MPAVETAPTASAAQTRAAGSRMIGFYMDGPVRVDCLFDTANFLTKNGNTFEALRSSDGDVLDIGKSGAQRLRVFANADTIGLFNVAGAGAGRDGLRILDGSVAFDVNAVERGRFTTSGFEVTVPGGGKLLVEQAGSTSVKLRSSATMQYEAAAASSHQFLINGTVTWLIGSDTRLYPQGDNVSPIGFSSNRVSNIYLANPPIVTSDEGEKTWLGAPTAAELAAARRIIAELGFFQWNDAIADKGTEGARYHFGVRAQAVWAIMADEGLIDPIVEGVTPSSSYAFLCFDEWPAVEAVAEERDEEGNITVAAVAARPAGNLFGIRPDQLALFLIAAQEARIDALEATA